MLHHVNVDRILAFWQVLHYENGKIEFNYKTDGLYATPKGTTVTAKSPLRPFENERGPLTSEDMTNIGDWGYTYEPIEFWRQSPAEQKRVVTQYVNKWYGPQRQATAPRAVKARGVAEPQYYANLEVERSELDLPAMVDLYVKGRHAGSFALLGMPMHGKSYEEIPLQQAIQDAAFSLNITSALGMREVLNHHLEARITKVSHLFGHLSPFQPPANMTAARRNLDPAREGAEPQDRPRGGPSRRARDGRGAPQVRARRRSASSCQGAYQGGRRGACHGSRAVPDRDALIRSPLSGAEVTEVELCSYALLGLWHAHYVLCIFITSLLSFVCPTTPRRRIPRGGLYSRAFALYPGLDDSHARTIIIIISASLRSMLAAKLDA